MIVQDSADSALDQRLAGIEGISAAVMLTAGLKMDCTDSMVKLQSLRTLDLRMANAGSEEAVVVGIVGVAGVAVV